METSREVELVKGPNIQSLPKFDPLPDRLEITILLIIGDDISTNEILPAGARILPYRSNIPKISEFAFEIVDDSYAERAAKTQDSGGHAVIAGENYGQGSSREHAALAPRHLGLRVVIAKSFARIHRQNLVNFGILPLLFADDSDLDGLSLGSALIFSDLHRLSPGAPVPVESGGHSIQTRHDLSNREIEIVRAGGLINWVRSNPTEDTLGCSPKE